MAAAPCHSDRGMLTTHYKYITAEKKCCSMQVRLYKLAGYMVDWQIEKIWKSLVADSAIRKVQPSWIEKANGLKTCFFSAGMIFLT